MNRCVKITLNKRLTFEDRPSISNLKNQGLEIFQKILESLPRVC